MNKSSLYPSRGLPRVLLLFVSLGFALMLGSGLVYRIEQPGLVVPAQERGSAPATAQGEAASSPFAQLMQQLDKNPSDYNTLIALTFLFLDNEDWENAEVFGVQAVTAKPSAMQGHYALGLALNGLGRPEEAAQSLEKAVKLEDKPEIRYSLGILYAYYLNKKAEAREHFSKGLAAPDLAPNLKTALESELGKL